jgi:hypothetical protein
MNSCFEAGEPRANARTVRIPASAALGQEICLSSHLKKEGKIARRRAMSVRALHPAGFAVAIDFVASMPGSKSQYSSARRRRGDQSFPGDEIRAAGSVKPDPSPE